MSLYKKLVKASEENISLNHSNAGGMRRNALIIEWASKIVGSELSWEKVQQSEKFGYNPIANFDKKSIHTSRFWQKAALYRVEKKFQKKHGFAIYRIAVGDDNFCLIRIKDRPKLKAYHKALSKVRERFVFEAFPLCAREEFARIKKFFDGHKILKHHNLPSQYGMVLGGLPGSGKTSYVNFLAEKLFNGRIQTIDTAELRGGESLENSGVVVVDDQYSLFQESSDPAYASLLKEAETTNPNVKRLLVIVTNSPENLSPAMQRPGRFERSLLFPLPGKSEIAPLFHSYDPKLSKKQVDNLCEKLIASKGSLASVQFCARMVFSGCCDSWEDAIKLL